MCSRVCARMRPTREEIRLGLYIALTMCFRGKSQLQELQEDLFKGSWPKTCELQH